MFGKLFRVFERCLLVACFLVFNVVKQRHEYGSSFELTRFCGSQECLNCSLDLNRYVANCTGLPVTSYLSMSVDVSHI